MKPACHWSPGTVSRFKIGRSSDEDAALAMYRGRTRPNVASEGALVNRPLIVPYNLDASANAKLKRPH